MFVPVVHWPGSWVKLDDAEQARGHLAMAHIMNSGVQDAALALHFFESVWQEERPSSRSEWELRRDLTKLARARLGFDGTEGHDQWATTVQIEVLQLLLQRGMMPADYAHRALFVHAKSFLFALDNAARALRSAAGMPGAPPPLSDVKDSWATHFPDLVAVRDTSHHPEDRLRGLGGPRRPPLPPGAIFLENLDGTVLSSTMANGEIGRVDISRESLKVASDLVNEALATYEWEGSPNISPRA